jgi:histidine triad (HIT) family protein
VVLTKAPLRTILDCEPEHLVQVMQIAQHIARAAMQVFAVDGITIQQFNESAGAQTVPHLHVHVIPRITGVPLEPPNGKTEKVEVLADQARCRDQTCGVQGNPPLFARCFAGLRKTN